MTITSDDIDLVFKYEGCGGCGFVPESKAGLLEAAGWKYDYTDLTTELCPACEECERCCTCPEET